MSTKITRQNAITENPIFLQSKFYINNNILTDPHQVSHIEIWRGNPDTDNSVLVETIFSDEGVDSEGNITSTGITFIETGIIEYIVSPLSIAGSYYDRVHFIPFENAEEETFVNRFDVGTLGGVSGIGIPTCRLFGTITDSAGEPMNGLEVVINKAEFPEAKDSNLVAFRPIKTYTTKGGAFSIYVQNKIKFVFSIPSIGYRRIFIIPEGVRNQNISQLDSWLYSPEDNPGEINDYLGNDSGLRPSSTGYYSEFSNEINMPVFDWGK